MVMDDSMYVRQQLDARKKRVTYHSHIVYVIINTRRGIVVLRVNNNNNNNNKNSNNDSN